jgi:hypothetical protein
MASGGILSEFGDADVTMFKKDMFQMIKVGSEIDRCFANGEEELDNLILKFEKLADKFNKKYANIKIKPKKGLEKYDVKVYIRENDLKSFFASSASRVSGIKSIGITNYNQVEARNSEQFSKFVESLKDHIYISYLGQEGTCNFEVKFQNDDKLAELIYFTDDLLRENSAIFKICAFYALKEKFDDSIDIYNEASTLGFSNYLNEIENRQFRDRSYAGP